MSISLNPQASIQKPFLNTLQEKPSNKDTNVSHIAQGILTREEAKAYQSTLHPESKLFQSMDRNMALYSAGIREVAPGLKVNMTKDRLKGGNALGCVLEKIKNIITSSDVKEAVKNLGTAVWVALSGDEKAEVSNDAIGMLAEKFDALEVGEKDDFSDAISDLSSKLESFSNSPDNPRKLKAVEKELDCVKDFSEILGLLHADDPSDAGQVQEAISKIDQKFDNCSQFMNMVAHEIKIEKQEIDFSQGKQVHHNASGSTQYHNASGAKVGVQGNSTKIDTMKF